MLIGVAWVGTTEFYKQTETMQKTIDGLWKANENQENEFRRQLKLTRDSLEVAYATIRLAHQESVEAHERSQKTIANLNKIIYISYQSDSARTNALKKLYKSYNP